MQINLFLSSHFQVIKFRFAYHKRQTVFIRHDVVEDRIDGGGHVIEYSRYISH